MAPYSFFGRLAGVAYLTSHAFEPLSIVSLNLRFHWRQRAWYLGPWNEQRGGRVYDCSLSPKERITSRGKVIWLCCHHEMVQRLRRDLPSSIWIRWYNRWSNENYFIVEVTYFFLIPILYRDFAALRNTTKFQFLLSVIFGIINSGCRDTACFLHDGSWCTCITGVIRLFFFHSVEFVYLHFLQVFNFPNFSQVLSTLGGAVALWLVRSSSDRAVRVRDLAGDVVLCSWARHFTLRVPLSTQVYNWVLTNLLLGIALRWTSIP